MTERTIYEIHINIKSSNPEVKPIMYTEGKKYATPELAYKHLEEMHDAAEETSFIEMNNLMKHCLHQKFVYPGKTTEIMAFIKSQTLVED